MHFCFLLLACLVLPLLLLMLLWMGLQRQQEKKVHGQSSGGWLLVSEAHASGKICGWWDTEHHACFLLLLLLHPCLPPVLLGWRNRSDMMPSTRRGTRHTALGISTMLFWFVELPNCNQSIFSHSDPEHQGTLRLTLPKLIVKRHSFGGPREGLKA